MAALTTDQILEAISSMTVLEVSELVKAMEEKFGVSAAAPVAVAAVAGPAAAGAAPAEEHRVQRNSQVLRGCKEDRRYQGSSCRNRLGPQGSQRPRRRRSQGSQGRRVQGRSCKDQGIHCCRRRYRRDCLIICSRCRDGIIHFSRRQPFRTVYEGGPTILGSERVPGFRSLLIGKKDRCPETSGRCRQGVANGYR